MVDCLAVGADGRDVAWVEFRLADGSQRGSGEMLAQDKIQFTDFGDGSMQTDFQNVLAQGWRERCLHMSHNTGAQAAATSRDLGDDGVYAVGGCAGHEADDNGGLFHSVKQHRENA
jgi:hypothetical protein